jgi:hypothetical protein
MTGPEQVQIAYRAIMRTEAPSFEVLQIGVRIDTGAGDLDSYIANKIEQVETSTIPAFVFAARFLGVAPSAAYLDELAGFARAQYASYVVMGSAQAQLGPYEALGRAFSATEAFQAKFGVSAISAGTSFVDAAYREIFGRGASSDAFANLKGQLDYFEGIYIAAGIPAGDAAIQARGAVYGQMIGYQQTIPAERALTVSDEQARAFLSVVAKGDTSAYGASLEGLPVAGREIDTDAISNAPTLAPFTVAPDAYIAEARTTIYGDHITGSIVVGMGIRGGARSIDAGAGNDVIELRGVYGGAKVWGGSGNDTISIHTLGAVGQPLVDGGSGNDVIALGVTTGTEPGIAANATIDGGLGNDTLTLYARGFNLDIKGVETIVGSSADDILRVAISSEAIPTSITLGAGRDALSLAPELANLVLANGAVSSLASITDFVKGTDSLALYGYGQPVAAPVGVAAAASLTAALGLVAAATPIGSWMSFEYGADTYIFKQNGDIGLASGDGLVKMAGVTGLTIGSDSGSDLIFL